MAKRAGILLIIAGVLIIGLIGYLYFSNCSMTIEKFQNAPLDARAAKESLSAALKQLNQDPMSTPPPVEDKRSSQANPLAPQATPSAISQTDPKAFGQAPPAPPAPQANPLAPQAKPSAISQTDPKAFGQAPQTPPESLVSPLATQARPSAISQAAPALPAPEEPVAPVPTKTECYSLYPPPPPSAEQCKNLYPVTLQQCASQFSCQTILAPIGGSTSVTTNSLPAPLK